MKPKVTKLDCTYKKEGQNVWALNFDDIPVKKKQVKDQQVIHLAPGSTGGNHKHARTEWFVAIGDLVLSWLDKNGKKQEQLMNTKGQLLFIEISPYLAHAVTNRSKNQAGVLFELADSKMSEVEKVNLG